jgi:hypothetical protein
MKALRFALVFIVSCALLGAPLARAQSGITVADNPPPEYVFGETLTFQLAAQSEARIKTVNLFYRSAPGAPTNLAKPRFIPGPVITATYSISLTLNPLPAYTTLEYWWEIEDTADNTLTTEHQTFLYADNRFDWRALTREPVTVHWYQGDTAFGQSAVDVASAALENINRDLDAPAPEVVNVYVYANQNDAQEAFQSAGRLWVGAHADPALGVVIVAVSPDALDADINLGIYIPHELTHVLIYRAAGDNYRLVPAWLNEGLAVVHQAQPNPNYPALLKDAALAGQLYKLESLCSAFPTDPAEAELAYAESESVMRYFREQYGNSKIQELLRAYADGLGCEAGVQKTLGISLATLESNWLGSLSPNLTIKLRPFAPWLALALLILFSGALFLILTFRLPKATPSS